MGTGAALTAIIFLIANRGKVYSVVVVDTIKNNIVEVEKKFTFEKKETELTELSHYQIPERTFSIHILSRSCVCCRL